MKYIKRFNELDENSVKYNEQLITESMLIDRIKDWWYDLTYIAKSLGYTIKKIPDINRLNKIGDKEGIKRINDEIMEYAKELLAKHPNHVFKSQLQDLMNDVKSLDDITHDEFGKNPSKFSKHQQDILLGDMKITDDGIVRDLDKYKAK